MGIKKILASLIELHDDEEYFVSKELQDLSEKNEEDIVEVIKAKRYVFVADNPGEKEISDPNNVVYLNPEGKAGKNFYNFLRWVGIKSDEIIVINKTIRHTKLTENLYNEIEKTKESQEKIATLINEIYKINHDINIMLLGFTDFLDTDSDALFNIFYQNIDDSILCKAYHHPSRRQLITIDEQKKIEDEGIDKLDYFIWLGSKQYNDRKNKVRNYIAEYQIEKES